MSTILTIANAEIRALFREKTMYSITAVFLFMTAASSFIGWSTFTTADAVYRASVAYLYGHGASAVPENPLHSVASLASFDNLIVYILLIGALLAIIIGHRSFMRERRSGILQVLFTRPISKQSFVLGKILGLSAVLFSIMSVTGFISIVSSFLLPLQRISAVDIGHALIFFLFSFCYMLFFALCGLFFAIVSKSESLALFIPICIWVGITFVLPELATGLTPTALLNPVTILQLPPAEGFFALAQRIVFPISLGWHYTSISGELLGSSFSPSLAIGQIIRGHWLEITTLCVSIFTLGLLSATALRTFDPREDYVNE
jgi:ABC-type transport system involved in multi-copper enzyme maturation permease subunit